MQVLNYELLMLFVLIIFTFFSLLMPRAVSQKPHIEVAKIVPYFLQWLRHEILFYANIFFT